MTRPKVWITAAVAVLVVVAVVAGALVWRHKTVNASSRPNMTLDQAGPVAVRYAGDTVAHITGSPTLQPALLNNVIACDDPEDHAAPGSAELSNNYDLKFTGYHDPSAVFDQVKAYWSSKGYKVVNDDPATLATRTMTVENPADGFRLSLARGTVGNLSLSVSSPCLMPGSGSPIP